MNRQPFVDEEIELLRKISRGDEEAFRQLYDQTHQKVYFYLYRLVHGRQIAEDILVETFMEVWRCAKAFKGRSRVTTWIFGIARNLAMNELGKQKKHEDISDCSYLSNGIVPDAEPMDRQRLLKEAMLKLSIKHQEILDLVFFHDLAYPEISQLLDIPVSTVKTRVFYAKEMLKQVLSQMGVNKDDL